MEVDITIIAPDDYEEGRIGPWMQVNSGGRFFPMNPRFSEVKANDIANGLALTCRYGGQGATSRYYSVAEHSVLMAQYAKLSGDSVECQLCCLLHDASEAYAGDVIRAMKVALGQTYKTVEGRIQNCVLYKYGLLGEKWDRHAARVKELDCRIVPLEKKSLFGDNAQGWAFDTFEPLPGVSLMHWSPEDAKIAFLVKLSLLCYELDMTIEGELNDTE